MAHLPNRHLGTTVFKYFGKIRRDYGLVKALEIS